ncbi:Secondary metabolism regulator LAE1 [Colletotrichum fructicola]|nr:Secondary metabolism regulator LAE1 [Colletotrichum fructicola]KAF4942200.1 Secondary metabolism regulator LAE1 [Colletotrichum fructicola]KAF5503008.1 Secondary metabolism regulator LAE1 [Colletotrichum fructicola]
MAETNIQAEVPPEADVTGDTDSSLGQDDFSATTSLRSSIIDYRVENGRTYHRYKEGKYFGPNDEDESNRLDLQHHLFLLTFDNRLGYAPPNDPDWKGRVLDVGTGTGIWSIDFGDEHPDAEVLGFDLSATQPEFVPPNVYFEVDDLDNEWIYSRPFDYIHIRGMSGSVRNWPELLKKCFENLKPGGYVELQEAESNIFSADGICERGAFYKSLSYVASALEVFGCPFIPLDTLTSLLPEAGFVEVTDRRFIWPLNTWPRDPYLKELGSWSRENLASNTAGMIMAPMTRVHGWRQEEVQVFAAEVRKDLSDRGNHGYWPIRAIWAKKPSE